MYRLLIHQLKEIVQITDDPHVEFLKGADMAKIKVLNDAGNGLAVLVAADGTIAAVGKEEQVRSVLGNHTVEKTLATNGGILLPGFVDGHSHPVFAGDRVHEFAMKLAGATYMEVQAAGGGIHFTTSKTREASEEYLLEEFKKIAVTMLRNGTTTLEAKSGYGLDTESELKMLHVLSRVPEVTSLEISATFCGAHAVPKGSTEQEHVKLICEEMLPAIEKARAAGQLKNLENIDAFCEKNVINVENTKKILEAGEKLGLAANFHAEELSCIGGAEMGASVGARAMSHLEEISDNGIKAMAAAGSTAVLLPSTAFILRLTPPPARKMIESGAPLWILMMYGLGVIVALGSDFNPNAYCLAMPMIMHLACVYMRLSMEEAITAAALNSAHSLGRGRSHGAITVGRKGDFVVLDSSVSSWKHIIYRWMSINRNRSYSGTADSDVL
ncbi:imidazolonepropionase [Ancylostoma caninum]|uniref:Probable imidazolonepropionase n=1 Tax=Ancylostoma caninum TaxID=29170 RepID=A0A368GHL3_ANCCA|nr:imidazolonepropionase [Ancylostoma caninum]